MGSGKWAGDTAPHCHLQRPNDCRALYSGEDRIPEFVAEKNFRTNHHETELDFIRDIYPLNIYPLKIDFLSIDLSIRINRKKGV